MKELRSGGTGELDCLQSRPVLHSYPTLRPFPPQVLRLSGGGVLFWNHMLVQVEWSGLKLHISNPQPLAPTLLAPTLAPLKQ